MKKLVIDGNTATSLAAYALSETAAIYPITPSSTMAENCSQWACEGKKNIFGSVMQINEMQSEAGAAGALHGYLSAGSLGTTFTASQGLLLMIPNMYKMAGELLPHVIHVSARALATHALSIFGDHSDIYSCRQIGYTFLASTCPQECYDMAVISHLLTMESRVPVLHFFDGFRTSHEINEVEILDDQELKTLVNFDAIEAFKQKALSSEKPFCQGTAQNPDIFFQNREACNKFYQAIPEKLNQVFAKFEKLTGRHYAPFEYFGPKDAKVVVVAMGSGTQTLKQIALSENCGVVNVRCFRPFDTKAFIDVLPKACKKICVLDRAKEPNSIGEPLFVDVCAALNQHNKQIKVIGGRYGLGGKDFNIAQAKAVFDNAKKLVSKTNFSVGIEDDVTNLSLKVDKNFKLKNNFYSAKFYGLGSDGTVGANKNSIKIIGEHAGKHVQAFFEYDSKKSGSVTTSHLRFGDEKINAPYLIDDADFISCNNDSFIKKFGVVDSLKTGGIFLLNTGVKKEDLNNFLPNSIKECLKEKKAKFYIIDAFKLASSLNLGGRINLIMQSAFFKLIGLIEYEKAKEIMKQMAQKTYGAKGEKVVLANLNAIENAADLIEEVDLKSLTQTKQREHDKKSQYFENFVAKIEAKQGDELAVSVFSPDGKVPTNTSCEEKRDIAEMLPNFKCENCIHCNQCSFVCPHACIRPVLLSEEEYQKAPEEIKKKAKKALGLNGFYQYMQVSPRDCTGCGSCANVCPAREKALVMVKKQEIETELDRTYAFSQKVEPKNLDLPLNVKSSQYKKPYFEFSGACAGCGETPYLKLLTQLCGEHLIIANATGCSSIYGANSPICPYAKDCNGHGVAWANSLFEDNAEFGFGIYQSYKFRRNQIKQTLIENMQKFSKPESEIVQKYLDNFDDVATTKQLKQDILKIAKVHKLQTILREVDAIISQTFFIVGGDGWAYDIGFGGLDHILASGENVKVLVLDTEVYSNTGGQASKATNLGASAKFAENGKQTAKKRLGEIAMTYKNVFVANVAMGASMPQTLQAFDEAIKYNGPALIICYATCINQGSNLSNSMQLMKEASDCGYINLYIYNPQKTPKMRLLSPEPNGKLKEFMLKENRFKTLFAKNPERANMLFDMAQKEVADEYKHLKKISEED